jgi:hypothetical protein
MGLIEFFIIVLVCCGLAWAACWIAGKLGAPVFVPYVIWGVACLIILVTLMRALGLAGIDPVIPKLK